MQLPQTTQTHKFAGTIGVAEAKSSLRIGEAAVQATRDETGAPFSSDAARAERAREWRRTAKKLLRLGGNFPSQQVHIAPDPPRSQSGAAPFHRRAWQGGATRNAPRRHGRRARHVLINLV